MRLRLPSSPSICPPSLRNTFSISPFCQKCNRIKFGLTVLFPYAIMKENYQKLMEEEIERNKALGVKPTLLLHACCATCSAYPIEKLREMGYEPVIYFFNPNIFPPDEFDKRFYMFAKANIDDEFNLYNIYYKHDLFNYPFDSLTRPKCVGVVPLVYELEYIPDKDKLDTLYQKYVDKVKRNVEGFVVNVNDNIRKYVRMKNGKLQEHFDRGE